MSDRTAGLSIIPRHDHTSAERHFGGVRLSRFLAAQTGAMGPIGAGEKLVENLTYDLIVVGCGAAALSSALAFVADSGGAPRRVAILESAPKT